MNINWKVRIKNKTFWITMIPAVLMLVKQVCELIGVPVDFTIIQDQLINIVGTVFMILAIVGVVTDHTTESFFDSEQAMTYQQPKGDDE